MPFWWSSEKLSFYENASCQWNAWKCYWFLIIDYWCWASGRIDGHQEGFFHWKGDWALEWPVQGGGGFTILGNVQEKAGCGIQCSGLFIRWWLFKGWTPWSWGSLPTLLIFVILCFYVAVLSNRTTENWDHHSIWYLCLQIPPVQEKLANWISNADL